MAGGVGFKWLFAQKPFDPPNHPKPPETPNFPENPALPRNPLGIPTEFIHIYAPYKTPLNSPEFARNFPNFPKFAQIPPNP